MNPRFLSLASLDAFPQTAGRAVHLGIGNYDGVHRGHRAIFETAQARARDDGGLVGALTFSPHPEAFFRGKDACKLIFSSERKVEVFAALGLDFVIREPFSKTFAELEAERFVDFLKTKIPTLAAVYVGDNFHFGAGRHGDVALLKVLGNAAGVAVEVVPAVNYKDSRISSTRIREAIACGAIADANAMLGQPYCSCGIVVSGNQLGRTIGFPTLNLPWNPDLKPRFGVYVVRLSVPARGQVFHGVANYGVRPTIATATPIPLLETFLTSIPQGETIPTYGDFICVEWIDFLREEIRFASLDALKTQLDKDKQDSLRVQ